MPFVVVLLGESYQLGDIEDRLLDHLLPVLAQRVENRAFTLLAEYVRHPGVVAFFLGVEGEYLLQVLLKNYDHSEDPIILESSSKVSCLFDEDLVEVTVIVLHVVQEIFGEVLSQGSAAVVLDLLQLLFQHLLTLLDDVIEVLELFPHVLLVYVVDLYLQVVYLLVNQLFYLGEALLDLQQDHVVTQVGLHICILAVLGELQLTQALPQQGVNLLEGLRPRKEVIGVLVIVFADLAQFLVVVAVRRLADANDGLVVFLTGSFARNGNIDIDVLLLNHS